MVEATHAQWKIAKIGEKQRRTAKISIAVRHLRPEVELMYLLRMRRYYRHKSRGKWCRVPEMTAPL